jgi:AbrB family looped-hinge helix DNA binding protein
MPTATLTSKGQITIPSLVRKRLKLKAGDRLDFIFEPDGCISLAVKRAPFEELRGILRRPGKRATTVQAMDRGIEEAVRARWSARSVLRSNQR